MRNEIDQKTKYPYHSYPLIQMNGLHTQILEFMTDTHPIKDEKDAKYYLSRLEMIPIVFSQVLEKMEKRDSPISVLPVVENANNLLGIVRIHDIYSPATNT